MLSTVSAFTVAVPNHALLAREDLDWLAALPAAATLGDRQRHALVAMRRGQTWTNQSFRETFPMDSREARTELAGLVEAGVATADGERGGRVYRIAAHLIGYVPTPSARMSPAPITSQSTSQSGNSSADNISSHARRKNWDLIRRHLRTGDMTAAEITEATGLTARQVQYALRQMREAGSVTLVGGQGDRDSRYRVVTPPRGVRSAT
ncbi:winged helix-turn-helix transcriptional regulator [Kineosporia sp. J2-2]|uniref:Winged helix-turn-helix transcriptional regulator n=1 Tax=Kineosporia corallincola TaxID=2835133 RepID=A0ABS5TKZ2_9ACTN|nr:winged helix-turn-helix domain-containing protein [Kineosporia corallincola]MBT0770259.1 winged helix-turn-helix transcriptional regulator [Kineosporia corallincola]